MGWRGEHNMQGGSNKYFLEFIISNIIKGWHTTFSDEALVQLKWNDKR